MESIAQGATGRKTKRIRVIPAKQVAQAAGRRFVGELVGLFPDGNLQRFLGTFDLVALQKLKVQKLVLDQACTLPWPGTAPLEIVAWLRDHEIEIVQETFLGTRRQRDGWYGKYRLILGGKAEVRRE